MKKTNTQRAASAKKREEAKKVNIVEISEKMSESDFESNIMHINLKQPTNAYNYFIIDMKNKSRGSQSLTDITSLHKDKWQNTSNKEREKYLEMQRIDEERFKNHMAAAQKFLLKKPVRQTATAFSLYCNVYVA